MRSPVNHVLSLAVIAALVGAAGAYAKTREPAPPPTVTGPAADYPMVIGAPYQVGDTTYTPEDKLNYDAVGYALVGTEGGSRISAAHKILPLPSYVEITSLDNGKSVLVRVERRGPMSNDRLIELSPGAAEQLGLAGAARPAVRVRRVNPPEQERAMLRAGRRAPERMETPKGLLDALNRKLNPGQPLTAPSPAPSPIASPGPKPGAHPTPAPHATPAPRLTPTAKPAPTRKPATTTPAHQTAAQKPTAAPASAPVGVAHGSLVVQVATFSTEDRANSVAGKLSGRVRPTGRFWRVRLGPFASQADAQAALAKAKAAGYSDARIQRAD